MDPKGHYRIVDEKWRLAFPSSPRVIRRRIPSLVYLEEDRKGHVLIKFFRQGTKTKISDVGFMVPVKTANLRRGGKNYSVKRITIPKSFRKTKSFCYGRTVILVDRGEHFELWPRK